MGEITREYRKKVADRIKAERDRTGLTQKEFAKKVGIANQTYNNLENGIGSLKIEHLHKIAENCGCDMGYLLGDYDNRTHEATDICKATGLSEEAVKVLFEGATQKHPISGKVLKENDVLIVARRWLIDSLIIDSTDHYGLIGNIMACITENYYIEMYKENPWFPMISKIIDDFDKSNMEKEFIHNYAFMLSDTLDSMRQEIEDVFSKEGYSKEEIDNIYEDTDQFFIDYRGRVVQKDILKGSLQNKFTKYIDKYFFEGENNGK